MACGIVLPNVFEDSTQEAARFLDQPQLIQDLEFRNVIAQGDNQVDQAIVWRIVVAVLPRLSTQLEPLTQER